jgi:ribonuclease P protein component
MTLAALKLRKDFKRLLDTGTKVIFKTFVLFYAPNDINVVRAGFIAAKKSFPTSVMRNRAKRRLREALRLEPTSTAQNFDIVIIARRACLEKKFQELLDEISLALKQVKQ